MHTALFNSFCDDLGISPTAKPAQCTTDYTYNFNMNYFSVTDHFILSGTLFDDCVERVVVSHDVDNTSDHDPIFLHLNLAVNNAKVSTRVFTPRVSWVKASVHDYDKYRSVLSHKLYNIDLPYAALLCSDFMCSKCDHKNAISLYAEAITDACLSVADSCIPRTCHS